MDIKIPFAGFYNSLFSDGLDWEEERFIEHWLEEENDDELLDTSDLQDIVDHCRDYTKQTTLVAQAYLDEYENWLNETLNTTDISLTWGELTSPREYNFTTDRIFAKISEETARMLFNAVDKTLLAMVCEDHLKSRDGFISFYDYDYTSWGEVEEWDANQLSMLLYALQENADDFDLNMYYRLDEVFYRAFDAGMDWPRFEQEVLEKRLEKSGEIEPDSRKFPLGVADTTQYVAKYVELNRLKL